MVTIFDVFTLPFPEYRTKNLDLIVLQSIENIAEKTELQIQRDKEKTTFQGRAAAYFSAFAGFEDEMGFTPGLHVNESRDNDGYYRIGRAEGLRLANLTSAWKGSGNDYLRDAVDRVDYKHQIQQLGSDMNVSLGLLMNLHRRGALYESLIHYLQADLMRYLKFDGRCPEQEEVEAGIGILKLHLKAQEAFVQDLLANKIEQKFIGELEKVNSPDAKAKLGIFYLTKRHYGSGLKQLLSIATNDGQREILHSGGMPTACKVFSYLYNTIMFSQQFEKI